MHRYRLATYRECKAHREWNTTCPDCGRKGKFSPYIDTVTMQPVDDKRCGRCNRLSNCGYHLPPREIKTHPNPPYEGGNLVPRCQQSPSIEGRCERASVAPTAGLSAPRSLACEPFGVSLFYSRMHRAMQQSQPWGHHLATWLRTRFPREQVDAALKRYHVGGTPDGATLWWQIDEQGRVHTGKAMQYNPLTGHRVKEKGCPVNWAHRMRIYGEPTDLIVPQCLFGLHLINENEDVNENCHPEGMHSGAQSSLSSSLALQAATPPLVRLVESEKTALILSLLCPDKVWLATGGKANFKESMLAPLIGLDVEVYPDADALADWYARAVELNRTLGTRLHIPIGYYDLMNHDEARRAGWDLADVVMGEG